MTTGGQRYGTMKINWEADVCRETVHAVSTYNWVRLIITYQWNDLATYANLILCMWLVGKSVEPTGLMFRSKSSPLFNRWAVSVREIPGSIPDKDDWLNYFLSPTRQIMTYYFPIGNVRFLTYEDRLQSSWTGGSAPLLCRGRRWLLCQVIVVGVT
jgi:hypothetical protein